MSIAVNHGTVKQESEQVSNHVFFHDSKFANNKQLQAFPGAGFSIAIFSCRDRWRMKRAKPEEAHENAQASVTL